MCRGRAVQRVALLCGGLGLGAGCGRAGVASFVPALELGIRARRSTDVLSAAQSESDRRWATSAFVGLRFRPFNAAAELPTRGELSPETWIAPCDMDDSICLQEAADAEHEVAAALGELQ
jgi:hypothetical protein